MKIEFDRIAFDATDDHDAKVLRIAKRGQSVKRYHGEKLNPVAERVADKIFWAVRTAFELKRSPGNSAQRQLSLLEPDRTRPTFTAAEANELANLTEDGLLYQDGVRESQGIRGFFSSDPPKFIDAMMAYGQDFYVPEAAEDALPSIRAFAGSAAVGAEA